jgi:hypothetical protein
MERTRILTALAAKLLVHNSLTSCNEDVISYRMVRYSSTFSLYIHLNSTNIGKGDMSFQRQIKQLHPSHDSVCQTPIEKFLPCQYQEERKKICVISASNGSLLTGIRESQAMIISHVDFSNYYPRFGMHAKAGPIHETRMEPF